MKENESGGEWFEDLPRTGLIYQLIDDVKASESRETRIQALKALGESGDPRAVRPIIECTDDNNMEIRKYATEGLLKLRSPRGVDALNARLMDKTEACTTRKIAADALGEIRSRRAMELLIECLRNREEDLSIREYVARILARTKSDRAYDALQCCRGENSGMSAIADEVLQAFENTTTDNMQNSWDIGNSVSGNHTVKEGTAFRR